MIATSPVSVGPKAEVVELADVVAGYHHRHLGVGEACVGQVGQRAGGHRKGEPGPRTASLTSAVAPSREIWTST